MSWQPSDDLIVLLETLNKRLDKMDKRLENIENEILSISLDTTPEPEEPDWFEETRQGRRPRF